MRLFDAAIASVLKHEGGYVNHPTDPGGETNFGISKRSYPDLDIKNLTRADAIAIYERDYWSKVPENLADDVRWFAFDTCVNSGPGTMRSLLNTDPTLMGMAANRLKFLANLSTWPTFGRGWTRRVAGVLSDISQHFGPDGADGQGAPHEASTVVLHGFPLALRWAVLTREPAELRGSFEWRSRGSKLDVKAIRK